MFPSPPGIVLVKFLQRQFIFIKGSDLFGRQDLCIDERSFIRFEYKRITGLNAHRLFKIIQCYNTESFLPVFIRDQQKIVCFMGRRQKEQSVYRIDECQWSIGLRYSFFQIRQTDLAIGENCNQDILFIFRIIREQDFSLASPNTYFGTGRTGDLSVGKQRNE